MDVIYFKYIGEVILMTIKELEKMIKESRYTVFFGGAGVSTESGLKDFRSKDGLYSETFYNESPEKILSHSYLMNHTENFFKYYKKNFLSQQVKPNSAHKILAKLEEKGKLQAIITQNIDNLHQLAGSKKVIELHGSIYRNYSIPSKRSYDGIEIILSQKGIPYDTYGEIIRPDVTLYEESLNHQVIEDAINEISKADLLIIGGTSLTVYPAASFISYFKGRNLVAINRDEIGIKNFIKGSIGEVLSKLNLDEI